MFLKEEKAPGRCYFECFAKICISPNLRATLSRYSSAKNIMYSICFYEIVNTILILSGWNVTVHPQRLSSEEIIGNESV